MGPDGLLYAVVSPGTGAIGFNVVAIDGAGTVCETYSSNSTYLDGNLSCGKIAFANNGQFFVAGANNLRLIYCLARQLAP